MSAPQPVVRCLALPLSEQRLLVPGTTVAEIISYLETSPVAGAPPWVLGDFVWRRTRLPLISMEMAAGGNAPSAGPRSRIAVLHTLSPDAGVPFYGVLAQGIPRVVLASENTLVVADGPRPDRPLVRATVQLDGELALVPDLDAIDLGLNEADANWATQRAPGGADAAS